ncbi:MAG: heat-inducible transcription repressor HrcA [Xanthomonadales bacterium]|nr:heat-inducible transcription repressor HrcA [Xanthomonadales bacterium]MCE7932142.1 heat-inducible transcription repressor HrcA [Xanthomonadales bacterium PRO6]
MHALDARARKLLHDLIARYIEAGEPVASAKLARECGLDLSPATIRNILADLEAGGLIRSPHTSAGRVPTPRGYRLFVDSLIEVEEPSKPLVDSIQDRLPADGAPDQVLRSASRLLSELTGCAGIVSVPRRERLPLHHIDFVQLAPRRLLVILVFEDGQVQNRLVQTSHPFDAHQLEVAARLLNEQCAGQCLSAVQAQLTRELANAGAALDTATGAVVEAAESALRVQPEEPLLISGERRLAAHAELADVQRLRGLFEAFERQRDLLELVENAVRADDVRLYIGEESGFEPFASCALITAPYRRDGRPVGVLGVIGPTRLDYQRVIPVVRATAQAVGAALNLA